MIKPINNGFVFKMPKITQIYKKNKVVNIFENKDKIEKTYIDLKTGKIIKKVIEWTTER